MDFVYLVLRNTVDWGGVPPTFAGVGSTISEALRSANLKSEDIEAWLEEKDLEIRAYFTVLCYDMSTSPPTKLEYPDLQRGGGRYLGRNR